MTTLRLDGLEVMVGEEELFVAEARLLFNLLWFPSSVSIIYNGVSCVSVGGLIHTSF